MSIRPDLSLEIISIPVADQQRAKQFYIDVMGFELFEDEEFEGPNARWITVVPPGNRLVLLLVSWIPEMKPGSLRGLILGTNDLAVTCARFRQKGVFVDAPVDEPQRKLVHFRDSEGNHWIARERRSVPLAPQTGASSLSENVVLMSHEEAHALIDAYLLGKRNDREYVFRQIATWRPEIEAAVPIVRAIALVGSRAADESLMALRLTISGRPATDEAVRTLKDAVAAIRKGDAGAQERYLTAIGAA